MRILFLGGTTLTGPYAVRRLHSLGHEVTVFHRGEHEAEVGTLAGPGDTLGKCEPSPRYLMPWSVGSLSDFRRRSARRGVQRRAAPLFEEHRWTAVSPLPTGEYLVLIDRTKR